MKLLNKLFGNNTEKLNHFINREAVIIDVRTPEEYHRGAIPESKNIPLQTLKTKVSEIKKWNKPVITCCASGMRSANAVVLLKNNGIEVINGGGYISLYNKIS